MAREENVLLTLAIATASTACALTLATMPPCVAETVYGPLVAEGSVAGYPALPKKRGTASTKSAQYVITSRVKNSGT
jgi:hypothetical protein